MPPLWHTLDQTFAPGAVAGLACGFFDAFAPYSCDDANNRSNVSRVDRIVYIDPSMHECSVGFSAGRPQYMHIGPHLHVWYGMVRDNNASSIKKN